MGWISSDSRDWAPCPSARVVRAVLLLSVMVLAGCGASHSSASKRAPGGRSERFRIGAAAVCADATLSVGSQFDSATGEHDDLIVVTNRSPGSCALDGYPVIGLNTDTKRLPFTYTRGGWPYVTLQRPRRVTLTPGGHGYFLVAKYRCDGGIVQAATVIETFLPRTAKSISIALRPAGAHKLDYCRKNPGDKRIDAGNRIAISPIEATPKEALTGPA